MRNMPINLRDYQQSAIDLIDIEFKKGNKRVLLVASPGAGKTEISAWMIARSLSYKFPSIFIVRGRDLVHNASARFDKNKIDHSVFMSKNWRLDEKKLVQVCSLDTMTARSQWPFKDSTPLIFIDEAHKDYKKAYAAYPNAYFIGMSGTPYTDMSFYDSFVQPIQPFELRDLGFLVPDKIYCPHIIDTSSVKMKAGDFDQKQLNSVVTQSAVVGNIVQDWKDLGENRPTVCFATSVEHSLQLKQAFCDAGIKSIHCDASSSDIERENARKDLENGKIKVLCNVDIFSTGWDCPMVSCIVLARPTWSLPWYLQAVGRGVRSYHGKSNCLVLDNAGNVFRHGTHFKVREISLEKPTNKKSKSYDTKITTCMECYFVFDPTEDECCPECGWQKEKGSRNVNSIDGKLVEYEEHPSEQKKRREKMIVAKYYDLEWGRKKNKLRPDWTFIQLFRSFSREEMEHLKSVTNVPDRFLPSPS